MHFSGNAPKPDQTAGVIGAAPGLAGSIQAMETVKLLLDIGTPLKNRLLRISGLDMRCHCMNLAPTPPVRRAAGTDNRQPVNCTTSHNEKY